ncbi:MAG: hypothetical protein Q8O40_07090 [Chloroflexota bacterium]|nr:hypothetical protein [Chloroflexota bacterium]
MNLGEMRTRVRRDLHDEDAASYRWTDNELDRHIGRVVRELSGAAPREGVASLTTAPGSRELSLASITDLVQAEAVEYPTGKYPARYVQFSLWAGALTLLVEQAPAGAEGVKLYYGRLHVLDATTSTIPPQLEDLVAMGAEGYAALEWASFATNRVNVGGPDTWRQYLTWGQEQLARFHHRLSRLAGRASVRARRLYVPAQSRPSQTEVTGP